MQKNTEYFEKYLTFLNKHELLPKIYEVDGPSYSPNVVIKGKKFLSFCSNNYLGLAGDERVKNAVKKAVDKYGVGSGSTRLMSGTLDIQIEFEKILSQYFGHDDSITFSSGFLANVGVIRMLVDKFPYFHLSPFEGEGVILSDELNHASIIDGVRLAKAERIVFKHSDMKDLEKYLKKNKNKRKLIITDGVFSMDGDLANLPELTKLSKAYGAVLMVDDSHAAGILGKGGRGTPSYFGVEKEVDVLMSSFTKAFGNLGGFISANKTISDYLRITSRSYIFSDPIPPALVAGLIETTKIIRDGDNLRKTVLENSDYLREGLKENGFSVLGEKTTIVPLLIGNEKKAMEFSDELNNKGIMAPCIRRPAVVEGKERIRFSVMASHTKKDIEVLLNACTDIGKRMKLIK